MKTAIISIGMIVGPLVLMTAVLIDSTWVALIGAAVTIASWEGSVSMEVLHGPIPIFDDK